ncbi:MAG: SPOR domain-containing protein [Treponemataceae bacterium]|nr:SPOR domain-containing protein [Treponemataceae bacterium]
MEQKRVLWIVAAVGLFLLVVIGTALWISSPINKTQPSLSPVEVAGSSWSRSNAQVQTTNADLNGMNSSSSTNSITSIDFTGDGTIQSQAPVNLNNLDSSTTNSSATAQTAQNEPSTSDTHTSNAGLAQTAVTLNVNITPSNVNSSDYNATTQQAEQAPKQTAKETVTETAPKQQTSTSSAATEKATDSNSASTNSSTAVAPKTTVTVASNTTATSATTTSSTKPATTTNTASSSAKVTVSNSTASSSGVKTVPTTQPDQFWVQVASFTGKKNAEDARTALSEQKITGEVFTYQDAQGTIYYRLRVGPYKTKSEAEYWHKIIKEIEQFNGTDSYVVNSTVK